MAVRRQTAFTCPNCNALYQVVRQEAGSETVDRQIKCSECGVPFNGREGKFVLKYFMLRQCARNQRKRPERKRVKAR